MRRILDLECSKCGWITKNAMVGKKLPRCERAESPTHPSSARECKGKNEIIWTDGGPGFTMLGLGYGRNRP